MSWVIFNNPNCSPDWLVSKLAKKVFKYQDDDKWFWKSGKRDYRDMLMQFTAEDRAMQIKKYRNKVVSALPIKWILFYQDFLSHLEYIILDVFHATGILTSRATHLKKIITKLKKSIFVKNLDDN